MLEGVLNARGKVLLKMNVPEASLEQVIAVMPCMKAPTLSRPVQQQLLPWRGWSSRPKSTC